MRYAYNELDPEARKIIRETNDYIEYESDLEVSKEYAAESCNITGKDFLTKNVNSVYKKVMLKLIEVYSKNVANFIDKYYKNLLINEIEVMLNYPVSKKELKKKSFTASYNVENLNKRIKEDLIDKNFYPDKEDGKFKASLKSYLQGVYCS